MKSLPSRCYLCGEPAMRRCDGCGKPICEEQYRLGVDARGQKQYLCLPCDDQRQQQYAVSRTRR